MNIAERHIAVLGSTGSIGHSTLEVIAASDGRLRAVGLSAHTRLEDLQRQADQFRPRWVVASCAASLQKYSTLQLPRETELLTGPEALEDLVVRPEVDTVVAAVVGSAGLRSTCAALKAKKRVALANKETLVMAGPLVMNLARQNAGELLPVDSEHSAIFQAIQAGRSQDVRRVILTASGGPFRRHSLPQMREVTVSDALAHPTWDMGKKITIDSATMMNKALEIIEARWLFDLAPDQISVVVHPQSVVHSMVEFRDGSIVAQLSPPDMRLPIQYALSYPERWEGPADRQDFGTSWELQFEPPDIERFPALGLGYDVAAAGGTAGAVLNAANEAAVAQFLAGQIEFLDIVPACRAVLENHHFEPAPTLETLVSLDAWAREELLRWVCA